MERSEFCCTLDHCSIAPYYQGWEKRTLVIALEKQQVRASVAPLLRRSTKCCACQS